jgi:hypothetical protein
MTGQAEKAALKIYRRERKRVGESRGEETTAFATKSREKAQKAIQRSDLFSVL